MSTAPATTDSGGSGATAELHTRLDDLAERMERAKRELFALSQNTPSRTERLRLSHKAEGVALALSYVEEERRAWLTK